MISDKTLKSIEYDKIINMVSECAVLDNTKSELSHFVPSSDFNHVKEMLDKTDEAYKLLYCYNVPKIYYFSDVSEELLRVDKGGVLNLSEILRVAENLKSARVCKNSFETYSDNEIVFLSDIANSLFTNIEFEKEISSKIISEDQLSDNASPRLYSIRKNIRDLNAKIREQLNSYMHGGLSKFLQESVVTMRADRYVIPVKSEYRSQVKGFIHDQSSSGSTVFIEPEHVMELNNELKKAIFDEEDEVHKILVDLSLKISFMTEGLRANAEKLIYIDGFFARAEFSFKNKCVRPEINNEGITDIINGRHLLIAKEKVVPISLKLGENYNFLLVTGPNTGGKTVSLKLTGLLSLMVMTGLFVPAGDGTKISVFNGIYCDIGDEQSIEQNLSTFSSHITNLINIINNIDEKSLVLLDEIGAGTDPEEGSALALAIIDKLVEKKAFGIITTHYSKLKSYAMENKHIMNASMQFDSRTLKPLYKINIGIPGSSNAIDIARTLGLDNEIIDKAVSFLSDDKIGFEKVLKEAENSKRKYDSLLEDLEKIKLEKELNLEEIKSEKEKIKLEREKINFNSRIETKRIVSDKLSEAQEIVDELKKILKQANLESRELFKASMLKNRLENSIYNQIDIDAPIELVKANLADLNSGDKVYLKSIGANATFISFKSHKKEAEVYIGDIKTVIKSNDMYNIQKQKNAKTDTVRVYRSNTFNNLNKEINVIGKNTDDALEDVRNFIDHAVVCNFEEVKIIHGVGAGILLKAIREYLKTDKNVVEFRRGNYDEGQNGVTIVKLR